MPTTASKTHLLPDERGRFGDYGGKFVPETLMSALAELEAAYDEVADDASFAEEMDSLLKDYVGRPTPLYFAPNLSQELGGTRVYLKREDLAHTGAHKINNALGQALLARRLGRTASSPRPAPVSTAWPLQPCAPSWAWTVSSTWARRTSTGSRPTCTG